jgi:hypothetical protein
MKRLFEWLYETAGALEIPFYEPGSIKQSLILDFTTRIPALSCACQEVGWNTLPGNVDGEHQIEIHFPGHPQPRPAFSDGSSSGATPDWRAFTFDDPFWLLSLPALLPR